ncbi:MAG: flavin reductase family protein [Candidatus Bathyarchaeota archaeon]|nr:flavin reductase family protein [Candidatus Bathyarchaeota archaeon]
MIEVSWSEAIRRKYPEPTILVVSCDRKGKPNVMPAGWSMVTSGTPSMLAVSIGHARYTYRLIEETGQFVLVFPNEDMKDLIDLTGSCSGTDTDKFSEYRIATLEPKYVKLPLIRDAVACFECKIRGKLVTGDHTIFAGEVLAAYISEKYTDRLYNFGNGAHSTITRG